MARNSTVWYEKGNLTKNKRQNQTANNIKEYALSLKHRNMIKAPDYSVSKVQLNHYLSLALCHR
jgi:translation initiation factor IF-3